MGGDGEPEELRDMPKHQAILSPNPIDETGHGFRRIGQSAELVNGVQHFDFRILGALLGIRLSDGILLLSNLVSTLKREEEGDVKSETVCTVQG